MNILKNNTCKYNNVGNHPSSDFKRRKFYLTLVTFDKGDLSCQSDNYHVAKILKLYSTKQKEPLLFIAFIRSVSQSFK